MQKKGNKYGTHRVIEPKGLLTQAAKKIDNNMDEIYSNEILCDVSALNIDSASFTQIYEACEKDLARTEQMILDIVNERGKMQNPVTGSGGMFIGTVKAIGEDLQDRPEGGRQDRLPGVPVPDPPEDQQDQGHPPRDRPRGRGRPGHPV